MDTAFNLRPRLFSTLTLRWVVVLCGVVFVAASLTMISTILVGRIYPSLVGVWSISGDVALLAAMGVVIVELNLGAPEKVLWQRSPARPSRQPRALAS